MRSPRRRGRRAAAGGCTGALPGRGLRSGHPHLPADVYALAVTLHEALMGRLPHPNDRAPEPPPPDAILSAALDHDPARRPTAARLGTELRSVIAPIGAADRVSATAD